MDAYVNLNTCKIIDNVKYITTYYNYKIENTYLDDCVNFTLRDINTNAKNSIVRRNAEAFLTGDLIKVPAILYESSFVEDLYFNFLDNITESSFLFEELEEGEEIDMDNFMKFEDWMNKFNELKELLQIRYQKIKIWEAKELEEAQN